MPVKKIVALGTFFVIIMLAVIFVMPQKSSKQNGAAINIDNANEEEQPYFQTTSPRDLSVNLVARPREIQRNASLSANVTIASRSALVVNYKNLTSSNIKDLQLEIIPARGSSSVPKYRTASSATAKYNKPVYEKEKKLVYDIPDVKAGQRQRATVFLYPLAAGSIRLRAVIKTPDGKIASSSRVFPLTIK